MRRTTVDFVMAFGRYAPEQFEITYHNIARPPGRNVDGRKFDAAILTYDLLSLRQAPYWASVMAELQPLADLAEHVIALPQDDYTFNHVLDRSLERLGTRTIFSPIETGLEVVYPVMSRLADIRPALTGYVDEFTVESRNEFRRPMDDRPIHVGQRVRMLPEWFGAAGRAKGHFAEHFAHVVRPFDLNVDISTREADVFHGDDWYRFLASCRATIGQKGGASICDPDGSVMRTVTQYKERHPDASFDEVAQNCLTGLEMVEMRAISPRLFDAAMLHTVQILIEDDYLGVFEPWVHYVPTDPEVSNIEEIATVLTDVGRLKAIARAADQALIGSGRFTYRAFVQTVLGQVEKARGSARTRSTPDISEDLQWRLSPALFEAVQRLGSLSSAYGATEDLSRVARDIDHVVSTQPGLSEHMDLSATEMLIGEIDLGPGLQSYRSAAVDILVECARRGALGSVIVWLERFAGNLNDWQSSDWMESIAFEVSAQK